MHVKRLGVSIVSLTRPINPLLSTYVSFLIPANPLFPGFKYIPITDHAPQFRKTPVKCSHYNTIFDICPLFVLVHSQLHSHLLILSVTVHTYGVHSNESGLFKVALRQEAGFQP